ncbi:MAG: hypothetical protein HC916_11435 [Coleofasciculaceae cyanobacterium SM2_1_6]|nr:hypothetical protein [Coleofasciculaceae cyanobacterium SM2_1_6]
MASPQTIVEFPDRSSNYSSPNQLLSVAEVPDPRQPIDVEFIENQTPIDS